MSGKSKISVSRRSLIVGGAAIAAASTLPKIPARAQAPAKWRRYNVASANGQAMLASYRVAIDAMLKLPPTDPRNWYRLAFTHFLDCPHGNWWLFPWHRAFTGYAEQIVRKYSGNEQFAFPYWDWTANPSVPGIMYQPGFDPGKPPFITSESAFQKAFQPALAASGYWTKGSQQLQQLQLRCIGSNNVLWDQIGNPDNPDWPAFFPAEGDGQDYPNARNPDPMLDCVAADAVSSCKIHQAMAAQDYMTFSSPEAVQHSNVVGFAVLEGFPHNKVHNNTGGIVYGKKDGVCDTTDYTNTGGFMQAFLSPVDPLFYLHHSNIDRLWDAWTQQQQRAGLPYLPPAGPVYDRWAQEQFLFYSDADGKPVTRTSAGDYASIGAFAYDYEPGSVGKPCSPPPRRAALAAARPPVRRFAGEAPPPLAKGGMLTTGSTGANAVRLQPGLVQLARRNAPQTLLAKVTLALPHHRRGQLFRILVHAGDPSRSVEAGTVSLFGHTMAHGLLTFTVPVDEALAMLGGGSGLKAGGYVHFRAVGPGLRPHHDSALTAAPAERQEIRIHSVLIEAH